MSVLDDLEKLGAEGSKMEKQEGMRLMASTYDSAKGLFEIEDFSLNILKGAVSLAVSVAAAASGSAEEKVVMSIIENTSIAERIGSLAVMIGVAMGLERYGE